MCSSLWLRCLNLSSMLDHWLEIDLLNHEGAVLRTKADAVAEGDPYVCFARFVGDVVEITIRVRLIEVDGWRDLVCMHGAECCGQTCGATRALRMADLRLRCRHRNPRRLAIERKLQGARLNSIVEQSRSTVQVHVVEVFCFAAGVRKREAHRARRLIAVLSESNAMIGVARCTVANKLT